MVRSLAVEVAGVGNESCRLLAFNSKKELVDEVWHAEPEKQNCALTYSSNNDSVSFCVILDSLKPEVSRFKLSCVKCSPLRCCVQIEFLLFVCCTTSDDDLPRMMERGFTCRVSSSTLAEPISNFSLALDSLANTAFVFLALNLTREDWILNAVLDVKTVPKEVS